jgi:hypothetical protein
MLYSVELLIALSTYQLPSSMVILASKAAISSSANAPKLTSKFRSNGVHKSIKSSDNDIEAVVGLFLFGFD